MRSEAGRTADVGALPSRRLRLNSDTAPNHFLFGYAVSIAMNLIISRLAHDKQAGRPARLCPLLEIKPKLVSCPGGNTSDVILAVLVDEELSAGRASEALAVRIVDDLEDRISVA
jgi:hypothetical protein